MVRVVVELQLAERHLQRAAVLQVGMSAAPVARIVAEVQIDFLAEKVVRRFEDVVAAEDVAQRARHSRRSRLAAAVLLLLLLLSSVLWQGFQFPCSLFIANNETTMQS